MLIFAVVLQKMDKIKHYESAILAILNEYAKFKYSNIDAENYVVADKEHRHYQLMTIGWDKDIYVHTCPMHFSINNGKIWVWQNTTEWEVGEMLVKNGVPKSDIVAGFFSPKMREYTEYAVG